MGGPRVIPTRRYGQERLYVCETDGRNVAWYDRGAGRVNLLNAERGEDVLAALRPFVTGQVTVGPPPVPTAAELAGLGLHPDDDWENSRYSRETSEWLQLMELCEERGKKIFITSDNRLYDLTHWKDRRNLREDALDSTLLNQASTGLTNVASVTAYTDGAPTVAELWPKIQGAASTVEGALLNMWYAAHAVMHSRRWN